MRFLVDTRALVHTSVGDPMQEHVNTGAQVVQLLGLPLWADSLNLLQKCSCSTAVLTLPFA